MATLKDQVIGAVITHSGDHITVADVIKKLPDANYHSITTCMARDLKNLGYIEKAGYQVPESGKRRVALYRILQRTFGESKPAQISASAIGMAIVRHIKNLEKKVNEIQEALENMRNAYNGAKKDLKYYKKQVDTLKIDNTKLREALAAKSQTFKLSELTGQ